MRLPEDLGFVNPNREEHSVYSVGGEVFFNRKIHWIVGVLFDLQKNPLSQYTEHKTGYFLLPDEMWFSARPIACEYIKTKADKMEVPNVVSD